MGAKQNHIPTLKTIPCTPYKVPPPTSPPSGGRLEGALWLDGSQIDLQLLSQCDDYFMSQAVMLAWQAGCAGEVPVGAVVVCSGRVVGQGYNRTRTDCDPTAHAEIIALRQAALQQGNYRLTDSTLYVTLEPCPMCAGAIVQARIARVVFAAADPRAGACGTVFNIVQSASLNHHTQVQGGVFEAVSADLLRAFFRRRR